MQRIGRYVLIFSLLVFLSSGRSYGQSGFQNVTSSAGLSDVGGKAAWAGYKNDGWVDLYAGGKVWRNNGASDPVNVTFTMVQALVGVGIWGDYNNDGWADVFAGNLFRNENGQSFTNVHYKIPTLIGTSRGCVCVDFNGDGYLDLCVGGYEGGN